MESETRNLSPERAVEIARATAGLDRTLEGRAHHVRRLDRPGADYYLVLLGAEGKHVAVAVVDVASGETLSWAEIQAGRHPALNAEDAIQRAADGPGANAKLVWRACAATRSPLDPLWEVRTGEDLVYVDQRGKVWRTLDVDAPRG